MTDANLEKLRSLIEQCMAVFEEEKAEKKEEPAAEISACGLEIHFIDVGQGDATLIKCGEAAMLIDAGNNTQGTKVRKYLLNHGVSKLDYLVGTHPGADHIGGLDSVLYNMPCDHLFLSDKASEESMETKSYQEILETAGQKGIIPEMPELNKDYLLGEATFSVLSPEIAFTDSNDASLVIRLTYGTTNFLFTGDATEKAENVMLASGKTLKSDVIKIGHHGSSEATSEAFLEAVSPTAAIISCGENNSYGHPAEDLLARLQKNNIQIYRTDLNGHIIAASDGSEVLLEQEKEAEEITVQNTAASEYQKENSDGASYILNARSRMFHHSNCVFANCRHQVPLTLSREECIAQGYKPCSFCLR